MKGFIEITHGNRTHLIAVRAIVAVSRSVAQQGTQLGSPTTISLSQPIPNTGAKSGDATFISHVPVALAYEDVLQRIEKAL